METVQENEFAIAGIHGDATDPGTTRRSFCRGGGAHFKMKKRPYGRIVFRKV